MSQQKVIDFTNPTTILQESQRFIHALDSGIQALSLDFGFHIQNSFLNDKIYKLRDNTSYRIDSSFFHLNLLFTELEGIKSKHETLDYMANISQSPVLHLEFDKRHLTYILDSMIFHLSSVFDYCAVLISYILSKTDRTPSWNTLESYARAGTNIFSTDKTHQIKQTIIETHNSFVRNLYDYRSEIMHRAADLIRGSTALELPSNKKTLLFLCSSKQLKSFKGLSDTSGQYTITYFAHYLIVQTIESLANIIEVLRVYMESNSISMKVMKEDKLVMFYLDPETKEAKSPSAMYWPHFDSVFHKR